MRPSFATTITVLLALGFQTALASEAVVSAGGTPSLELCEDTADGGEVVCREWAWHGECEKNKDFMEANCRKSCKVCVPEVTPPCEDAFPTCQDWALAGRCTGFWQGQKGPYMINAPFVVEFCPKSCGVCDIHLSEQDWNLGLGFPQTAPDLDENWMDYRIRAYVAETRRYLLTLPPDLRNFCKFGHINCVRFAIGEGQCEENADHYIYKYLCAAACKTCDKFIDPEERAAAETHYKDAIAEAQEFWEYQKRKKEMLSEEEW